MYFSFLGGDNTCASCNHPLYVCVLCDWDFSGVYGFPRCPGDNITLCNFVREMLNYGAYTS